MDGSSQNYQPGPNLPTPQMESANVVPEQTNQTAKAEVASHQLEQPGSSMGQTPVAPIGQIPGQLPIPTQDQASVASPVTNIPVNDSPDVADDADLIEKEWVNKAKYIVNNTREDPYIQNQEMNKFKADYIQKRYNKQLKVSDE